MATGTRVRIATRGSALARWQANYVADRLVAAHPDLDVTLVIVDTAGDRRQDIPVWEMGGQGVFVKEVQAAVLAGRADIAVHSAKDLPSVTDPGLWLACVPVREDPRDALVGMQPRRAAHRGPGGHRVGPAPGPAGRAPARPDTSPACGATSPPGWPRRRSSTPSWWRPPPCTASGWRTASPRSSTSA